MTTTYFGNLHDEALALLIETRNYIQSMRSQKQGVHRLLDTGGQLAKFNKRFEGLGLKS